jgi:hypothetical protein
MRGHCDATHPMSETDSLSQMRYLYEYQPIHKVQKYNFQIVVYFHEHHAIYTAINTILGKLNSF